MSHVQKKNIPGIGFCVHNNKKKRLVLAEVVLLVWAILWSEALLLSICQRINYLCRVLHSQYFRGFNNIYFVYSHNKFIFYSCFLDIQ